MSEEEYCALQVGDRVKIPSFGRPVFVVSDKRLDGFFEVIESGTSQDSRWHPHYTGAEIIKAQTTDPSACPGL